LTLTFVFVYIILG